MSPFRPLLSKHENSSGSIDEIGSGDRLFRSHRRIRFRVMAECKEPPPAGLGKPLAVFYRCVNPVELNVICQRNRALGCDILRAVAENRCCRQVGNDAR